MRTTYFHLRLFKETQTGTEGNHDFLRSVCFKEITDGLKISYISLLNMNRSTYDNILYKKNSYRISEQKNNLIKYT